MPQHSYLFSGTLAENLRMAAPEATDEELWQVLETAQADALRPGAAAGAGDTGEPGRHQLLRRPAAAAVHRPGAAPARRRCTCSTTASPPWTTAPTSGSAQALAPLLHSATVLVVAERVATIEDAGLILVLEDGRLVAQGTHQQLLESSPTYREIAASQLVLEETP